MVLTEEVSPLSLHFYKVMGYGVPHFHTDQVKQSGLAVSDHFQQRWLPLPKLIRKKVCLRLKITIKTCLVRYLYQTKYKSEILAYRRTGMDREKSQNKTKKKEF